MNKKYIIYGLGVSGISVAKSLISQNLEVIGTQDNEESLIELQKKHPDINFQSPENIAFDENTIVVFSPGIPLYFPKRHKILDICQKTSAQLVCDLELFYQQNYQNNFIGITGTNGKSTTTSLTGFVFEKLGIGSQIGGNIGVAAFDLKQQQKNFTYIFELSSYQLDLIDKSHFKIACLLNITPDHIDRHGSFENYIKSKKRIFLNQQVGDFSMIDVDNENSRKVFEELQKDDDFKANLIPISAIKTNENGISLIDGKLISKIAENNFEIELTSEFLKGKHSDLNMAFAFATTYLTLLKALGQVPTEIIPNIIKIIKEFKGLSHRLEFIGKIDNISFINDSKATNAQSSQHALKAYENSYWILGGKAKEGGISELEPYFKKVKKAYLIGESSEEFAENLKKNSVDFDICGDLKTATKKAFSDAKNNSLSKSNILLSPACASFDQWKNFEERGDYFCKIFDELQNT